MKYIVDVPEDKINIRGIRGLLAYANTTMTPYDESSAEQRGQDEAWELATKIFEMSNKDRSEANIPISQWHWMQYSEAREKYEAWKKEKEEIKIGDEVAFHRDDAPDTVVVVTYVGDDGYIDGMDGRGTQYAHKNPDRWTKTGRTFPELVDLLEKMRKPEC